MSDVANQDAPVSAAQPAQGLVTNLLKQAGGGHRALFDQVLVPLQPKGKNPPFFCVHGDSGRSIFFSLARNLGKEQPFYAVQSVGLDGKARLLLTLHEMAARYIQEIRQVQPNGPYLLGGFCMGGAVALEMAQQLQGQGEKVALVAMLDTHAPWIVHGTENASPYSLGTRLKEHWENFKRLPRKELPHYFGLRVEHVNFIIKRQLWELAYALCRLTGRPLPKFLQDMKSINTHAFLEYKAKPYAGKITLLNTDGTVKRFNDPKLGWSGVPQAIEVRIIPGLHDTIMSEANVKGYAQELKQCIAEALRGDCASGQ